MDNIESTVNAGQESVVETQESTVNTETTANESAQAQTVEVAEPQQKQVQSREENAKIAAARREAESKAKDQLISEMYGQSHGIHTYADYQKAVEQQKEQERRQKLQEKGIDPTEIEEIINNHPKVKKSDEVLSRIEEEQRKQTEYQEFFEYFRNENGRDFNSATDQIPTEVWEMTTKGKTLTDAYAIHHAKSLKAKIAEYEAKLKAQETNEKNANSSPGSVTGNGQPKDGFISFDLYESNKHDQAWVNKNFKSIMSSRSQW